MYFEKQSSYDSSYKTGDLSIFPKLIDDYATLYEARNLSETNLKFGVNLNSKIIILEDGTNFPQKGILKIGKLSSKDGNSELVYYYKKEGNTFSNVIRGFQNSKSTIWPKGTLVTSGVFSEHHNALKDSIEKIENKLGEDSFPIAESLNGLLKSLETNILGPKPIFRAYPLFGKPPFTVKFKNFSIGNNNKYFWDFGDNTTSIEESPDHTYIREGIFTVQLNVINELGGQGIATKSNYINSNNENTIPLFYILPRYGGISKKTAIEMAIEPTKYTFVDQTDGNIVSRFFVFGDNNKKTIVDPNIHVVNHIYNEPGEYKPFILDTFQSQNTKKVFLQESLIVG
jgi:PKD repeat protein